MKWFAFAETVMQVFFSEVVINGKPGSVLNCEEAVLQVAEGSIDGLGFAEVRHEVGWEKTVSQRWISCRSFAKEAVCSFRSFLAGGRKSACERQVSFPAAKKLDTGKAKLHRSPAQAIGCMTGSG